jgi:hypothetical protein
MYISMAVEIIDPSLVEIVFAATQHCLPAANAGGLIEIKIESRDT